MAAALGHVAPNPVPSFADLEYDFLVDGQVVDDSTVLINGERHEFTIRANANPFRGALIRVEGLGMMQPGKNSAEAVVCTVAEGVGHTENSEKTVLSGFYQVFGGGTVIADVTVVELNVVGNSVYSYQRFTFNVVEFAPVVPSTESPIAMPVAAPTNVPVTPPTNAPIVAPTVSPVDSPTRLPIVSATNVPTIGQTESPVSILTKVPVAATTASPIAPVIPNVPAASSRSPSKSPLDKPSSVTSAVLVSETPSEIPNQIPSEMPVQTSVKSQFWALMKEVVLAKLYEDTSD